VQANSAVAKASWRLTKRWSCSPCNNTRYMSFTVYGQRSVLVNPSSEAIRLVPHRAASEEKGKSSHQRVFMQRLVEERNL
jgi:hypothetical protein